MRPGRAVTGVVPDMLFGPPRVTAIFSYNLVSSSYLAFSM